MGERLDPAATSTEPLRVQSLPDVLGNGTPPVAANLPDQPSDPEAAGATKVAAAAPSTVEQAYYEEILEHAPEAISIVDLDLNITRVNAEFTRLFGFAASEAVGKRLDALIVPPDRYAETAWISESMKTQNKLSLETRRRRKDGSLVEVLLSTSPATVNGKKIGSYACYRDITEQKRTEELNAALYAIAARSQCRRSATVFCRRSQHRRAVDECPQLLYRSLRPSIPMVELPIFCRRTGLNPRAQAFGPGPDRICFALGRTVAGHSNGL